MLVNEKGSGVTLERILSLPIVINEMSIMERVEKQWLSK